MLNSDKAALNGKYSPSTWSAVRCSSVGRASSPPMGPYSVSGNTDTRVFQNGTVTVNLASESSTIQLNS